MRNEAFIVLALLLLGNPVLAQKFEPEDGKCLVFIGQDLEATGGLDRYNKGYTDYFKTPAGITVYTNLSPGNESYGYFNKGLDGLKTKANWGAGDSWANLYLQDSTYQNSAIAIGVSFVNNEKNVANGKHDHLIKELAHWIKSAKRPVFLRIGYEFDGWDWNHYKKKHYLKSWQRIHSIFKDLQVENVAFVWQSKGSGSNQEVLEEWYPGNDIVDWVGYSYFGNPDQEMLTFARKHNKPVFIAEATPVREIENLYFDSDIKKEKLEKIIWEEWFVPFFNTIKNNSDVIKAFSYINSDWSSQPMWINNPVFQKVDSRIQESKYISEKWQKEMEDLRYLNASTKLWN
ncbi:1,4-beta-xylanase [Aureitalea sp. L0-47]|uniref:glycoside hydrolase family 26 protein n=1 Tax=Aureitalea sp. L0-47 TaxID=2816962 RepID=UPI002237D5B1|nr:1,4-beta-xylanase [Aureitalea sp. L0-47]MCW5518769.1 1,4-beta-xylanase [Aureitalea sp. L0-47]